MEVLRLSALRTGRLYPRKNSWYSFMSRVKGCTEAGRIRALKNSNRTRNLPACMAVPQTNAKPRVPTRDRTSLDKKKPVAEAANYTTHSKHTRTSMPSAGFKPTIPVIKWLQTYALYHMVAGIKVTDKY